MSQKFTSTIAGASIFISLVGLLSRGLGFIREMVFASNFGLETDFDLYLVGAVLPTTINSIILYIGQNYFVPGFQKIRSENPEAAKKYFNQSFILFIGAGIIIAILLFFLSDLIISNYMQESSVKNKEIAAIIFRIFLFTIPFSAGISILSALLQSVYEFKYPAISMLFLNISVIILLLLFSNKIGVFIIPAGFVIGTILQFTYLVIKSREFIKLKFFNKNDEESFSKSIMTSTILIIILVESISQLYTIVDRYFYNEVSPGGIASLNYAMIIFVLPISIFSIALATAIFPKITKAINESVFNDVEVIYNESISINLVIFIPISFILFFFGDTIIKVLFERGKFIEESTNITYGVLKCYAISISFYSVYAVLNKIFYGIKKIKLLLLLTVLGLLLKFIMNFLLIELKQNGFAISTSVSYIFFFISSYFFLNYKLKIKNKTLFMKEFIFLFLNCAICIQILQLLSNVFSIHNQYIKVLIIILFILFYSINLILLKHYAVSLTAKVFNQLSRSLTIQKIR